MWDCHWLNIEAGFLLPDALPDTNPPLFFGLGTSLTWVKIDPPPGRGTHITSCSLNILIIIWPMFGNMWWSGCVVLVFSTTAHMDSHVTKKTKRTQNKSIIIIHFKIHGQ